MWDWLRHILKAKGIHQADIRAAHNAGYQFGYIQGKLQQAANDMHAWTAQSGSLTALHEAETILEAKNYNG